MILKEAIIPYHPKDSVTIQEVCNGLKSIVDKIFIISFENPNIPGTIFVDERNIKNILPISELKSRIGEVSGWIYQQLLKLGANQIIEVSDNYLICDADIIFLKNPYKDVPQECFPYAEAYTGEYHEPYRKHYEALMKRPTTAGISFINHHMVFNRKYVTELKRFIEDKNKRRWDVAILDSLLPDRNFSEYDLYGNWMTEFFKDRMLKIDISIKDINVLPTQEEIDFARSQNYEILSNHLRKRIRGK